jgi:hypothetical protein
LNLRVLHDSKGDSKLPTTLKKGEVLERKTARGAGWRGKKGWGGDQKKRIKGSGRKKLDIKKPLKAARGRLFLEQAPLSLERRQHVF